MFRRLGHARIAGVDEVGRGAWAGPLVAAAVVLPRKFNADGVNDSKMLTPKKRQQLFVHITRQALAWAVGVVEPAVIDQRGLTWANQSAMISALKKLRPQPQAVLVDAMKIKYGPRPVKAIIHGDRRVVSIAAASIVAKVVRDELMTGLHRRYPVYEFHYHKGYGTRRHQLLLRRHGPSAVHRRSYRPIKRLLKTHP